MSVQDLLNYLAIQDPSSTFSKSVTEDIDGTVFERLEYIANRAGVGGDTLKVKAADETRTTTTTLANDNELYFAVAANTSYTAVFKVFVLGPSAPDIKLAITGPSGAIGKCNFVRGTTDSFADLGTAVAFTSGVSSGALITVTVGIRTAGTAGNCRLQWAQDTSDATASYVYAGSSVTYRPESA